MLIMIMVISCKNDIDEIIDTKTTDKCVDADGNIYNTMKIGNQIWMTEILKTTKYRNGDPIATTTPRTLCVSYETAPNYYWSYPGGITTYDCTYYTWYAITDKRQIAPVGWHVPTKNEWKTLFENIKNDEYLYKHLPYGYRCHSGCLINPSFEKVYYATSSEYDENKCYLRCFKLDNSEISSYLIGKDFGLPVICVKD